MSFRAPTALALLVMIVAFGDFAIAQSTTGNQQNQKNAKAFEILRSDHDKDWREMHAATLDLERYGRYDLAEENAVRTLTLAEHTFDPDDRRVAISLKYLGWLKFKRGNLSDAETLARRSVSLYEKTKTRNPTEEIEAYIVLINILCAEDRLEEAELECRKTVQWAEKKYSRNHPCMSPFYRGLGEIRFTRGKTKEAESLLKQALSLGEKMDDSRAKTIEVSRCNQDLAIVLEDQDRPAEAIVYLAQCIKQMEIIHGKSHPLLVSPLADMARCQSKINLSSDAEATFRRAIAIADAYPTVDLPEIREARDSYSAFLTNHKSKLIK